MSLHTEVARDRSFGIPDPHTVTELSNYMQNIFQQMQETLQQTSEKITTRNILFFSIGVVCYN